MVVHGVVKTIKSTTMTGAKEGWEFRRGILIGVAKKPDSERASLFEQSRNACGITVWGI
jgi:hypothetical protein